MEKNTVNLPVASYESIYRRKVDELVNMFKSLAEGFEKIDIENAELRKEIEKYKSMDQAVKGIKKE